MGQEHGKHLYIYGGKSCLQRFYREVTGYQRDVTKVRVDTSVISLEARAFFAWRFLQTVTLPNTITSIGDDAFYYCSSLESIALPNSITTLGNSVFTGCSSLIAITLPSSITALGNYVFRGCSSLASITLPNSITTLGEGVFAGCSSLASITLPNNITTLGDRVFFRCSSLTAITLPNSITTLGYRTFFRCSSLASVHLSENLTSISLRTFEGCVKLTTIEAPYLSTTTLDNNSLDSFNNPDGLKNMLLNAGFSKTDPDDIISNRQNPCSSFDVYYEWKRWARTRDVDGRFPLFTAAARCLKWSNVKQIFTSNMPVVIEIDVPTGLPLFMLAATGPTSDIESVYNLLKEYPAAMNIMNNSHD